MPSEILEHFDPENHPPHLQGVARTIANIAAKLDDELPKCAEKTAGLRKLLEAQDCMIRAARRGPVF